MVQSDDLYAAYNDAIGSLMLARKQYADACEEQGAGSPAAEQAKEQLARAIRHRDEMREQYGPVASWDTETSKG